VIGNGGLIGGLMVIGLALGITTATGLALSSIATNTRLGAGGPYAIISRSLGLEIGGSVGLPLYISQALAVAMYLFGFREGWLWLFPTHSPLAVDLLGLPPEPDLDRVRQVVDLTRSACMFLGDSGSEDALV
jgi:solute carrier family 12 sodium/potassium/chloride transporter 2